MITVGYGDVKPTNPLEVGVCIVLMMTCCLVFGFAINQIGYIFQDVYLREKNIFQKRNIISKYMQKKEINSKVQQQVFEYLEYTWREEIDEHIQEANIILNQLSGNLKQLISLESNKLILKQNRILKDNFDKQILQEIIPYIQEQNCTPGEIVIDCQIGNVECYLYFVQQGQLEFFSNGQKSEKINNYQDVHSIKKIFQGENFGQQSFFTGAKENLGVRSLSFSTLLKIKRSDFVNILKQYQSDYEKFCMIKDKIIFSGFYAQLNEQCSSCKERTHSEILCPILHYIPKKFKILQENDRNFPHITRNSSFQRNISHKTNTLKELENNVYRIVQFIEDKCEDLDQFENQNLEYPCFQNEYNNSFNEIDEHQDKVFQNASNEQMQPQFQKSSLVKDEIAFPRRRSKILALIHTNSLMNSQKALDEEIQQHIQNQSEEGSDLVNKRKRLNQIKKNVISESMEQQNNKLTQELDELTESHLYQKYGQNNRVSFINQSLKDLQISEKCTKHQISSENANNFQVQIENQAKVSIDFPSKFILHSFQNYDFEVFQGKFESLQNFKYYYPFQNCKEIINKLNEINLSKRNKMGIKKTSKNDNSTCYGRRNNLFKFIQQLKSSHRDQKTDSNQISINQSFEFNIKQQNADFSSNKQAQNSSSKLEQSNISSFEEIQLNQSKQSNEISNQNQNNTIKVDLEIPLFEEDQEHFQIQPSSSQCKRSYLFGQQSQLQKSLY